MRSSTGADAYGHEVWDYFVGRRGRETVERDDGLVDPSETLPEGYFAPLKEWDSVERRGIAYAKGRVLDVGCGPGRVALYLQRYKKLRVLGIDNSPLGLKVARARGLKRTRLVALEEIDFPPDSFDSVVMYGNNFGLFGSKAGAKRLLRKLYSMTSPNAVVICSSVDPHRTNDPDHLRYQRRNKARGRLPGQVRIRVRYRTYLGRWLDYLLVSPSEMEAVVEGTGWRVGQLHVSKSGPLYVGVLRKAKVEASASRP